VLEDAKALATAPFRMDASTALFWGGAAAAVGGLILADDDLREWTQKQRGSTLDSVADVLDVAGSGVAVGVLNLGLVAGGLIQQKNEGNSKLLKTAIISTEAQLFAEGLTAFGKLAVGRNDPGEGRGTHSFEPFSNLDGSFPSGHAARSFAVAAVFADQYEQPISLIAYGLAGLISLSRVYEDEHFASDVVAGAFLGYAIGKFLVRRHKDGGKRWALIPMGSLAERRIGLGAAWVF
jgi:membrane-associated phospholipid phosphatase